MESTGSAPISSIFYLTKRKKLSERLLEHRNENLQENQQYYYENIFNPSFHSRSHSNVGLHKNLVRLSQDRRKYETSDGVPLDVDDGLNRGLSYLSQHSDLVNLNDVDEFSRNYSYKNQHQDKHVGKIEEIANLLNLNELSSESCRSLDPLERDLELSNMYVGPLNVSEVGNLIVLALKLQENEKLDLDLEKRLEVSAQLWKNNKVPNTVSTSLISSLFKNKPHQCETCGLRFNLSDTKKRHEMTHKPKADKFWYSLDGWIHLTSKGAFGFTYSRSQVTLDTFRTLLREIKTDNEIVSWLRSMLFPNEKNFDDAEMEGEGNYGDNKEWEMKENVGDEVMFTDGTSESVGDERTLWSWGIMDSCSEVPAQLFSRSTRGYRGTWVTGNTGVNGDKRADGDLGDKQYENKEYEDGDDLDESVDVDAGDYDKEHMDVDNHVDKDVEKGEHGEQKYGDNKEWEMKEKEGDSSKLVKDKYMNYNMDLDLVLMKEVMKRVTLNLFMVNLQKQVIGSFSDMAKAFCTLCKDSLSCEFDVKYNKFVYVNTTAFQVDFDLVNKLFGEYVPLSYLLSLDDLQNKNTVHLLKKIASIKVLCLDVKSKRELAVTDWSFKYTKELLDIDTSIPKMEDVKHLDKLVKGWKNPFKVNGKQLMNCVLYSHTCCLKLLLNSHLRWAKILVNSLEDEELRKQVKKLSLV